MRITRVIVLVAFSVSTSAFANIEIEVGGGVTRHILKDGDSDKEIKMPSTDVNFYFGYRPKKSPFSMGMLVSQKKFDLADYSKLLGPNAKTFYEDPSRFPSVADITSAESSGSWAGMVYGPQFSLSYAWKHFAPYLRLSFQMGTLKNLIDYKSKGNYMSSPLEYDFKLESELKATFIQYGLGFRVPMGISYIFTDFGVESLTTKSTDYTLTQRSLQNSVEDNQTVALPAPAKDQSKGTQMRFGAGLNF